MAVQAGGGASWSSEVLHAFSSCFSRSFSTTSSSRCFSRSVAPYRTGGTGTCQCHTHKGTTQRDINIHREELTHIHTHTGQCTSTFSLTIVQYLPPLPHLPISPSYTHTRMQHLRMPVKQKCVTVHILHLEEKYMPIISSLSFPGFPKNVGQLGSALILFFHPSPVSLLPSFLHSPLSLYSTHHPRAQSLHLLGLV